MKIVIVANGFPTPQDPQWGCFERDQALALKNMGHEVSIIALDTRYRKYNRKHGISIIHSDNITIYWGYWFPTRFLRYISIRFKDWVTSHLFDQIYKRLLKDFGKPDVLYAHFQRNIYFSMFLKNKYDIPLIGIEHWSVIMQNQLPAFVKQRGEKSYPFIDKLLVVSKALNRNIKSKFNVDSEVVYDMLGSEFLDYTPCCCNNDGIFRFIAIGSLLPRKGFDILIKAFAESGLSDKRCIVNIIGDGPERQTLSSLINDYKLNNSVFLLGRKEKKDIVQALRDSDVFVLSSRSETFGVVCIEAMSQGLPCIATWCGGPEEFLTEEDGILIQPDNQNDLMKALCKIYREHAKYSRKEISARCLSRFSPQVIAGQLTNIFVEVLKSKKK